MTISEILALTSDSSPRLIFATDEEKFYYIAAGAAGSTATWIANGAGGDFLPLAGGTMDTGADITFANYSRLREGLTDAGNGGNGGISMVCSQDYEFKWEAGRLYVMEQDGFTIRAELFGFTDIPNASDDETKGYVVGSRRILDDGTIYVCTYAVADNATWNVYTELKDSVGISTLNWETGILASNSQSSLDWLNRYLYDGDGVISVEWNNRQAKRSGGTTELDWENCIIGGGAFTGRIDWSQAKLENWSGSVFSTVIDWANGYLNEYYGTNTLDWFNRILKDGSGNPIAKWGEDNNTGVFGIAFSSDGMGNFYHLLNGDGLKFLGACRYGQSTIDYNGTTAIDVANYNLIGPLASVDWNYGYLYNGAAVTVDWVYGSLSDANGITVNWGASQLKGPMGVVALEWSSGIPVVPSATLIPNTVAALTGGEGTIAYVNDADTPVTHGQPVVGGGVEKALVCFNGTDWIIVSHLS